MKIRNIKINGIREPIGFAMPYVSLSWLVEDTVSKKAISIRIQISLHPEFESILYEIEGKDLSSLGTLIPIKLQPRTRYFVRIVVVGDGQDQALGESFFETGKAGEEITASWIGMQEQDKFHPIFFREFTLSEKTVSARLYVTGLGLYEAEINCRRCGEEMLAPNYSNYEKEVQMQTYDVGDLLQLGENCIEITCGNGWYKGRLGYAGGKEIFGDRFQALAELHMVFSDGSTQMICSDERWFYRRSDFEFSDIYDGECLNRLIGAEAENAKVPVALSRGTEIVDRSSLPIVVKDTLSEPTLIKTPAGEYVLDFGQNFSGMVEYDADFPSGTKIVLDHGEVLQDGNFYNANYRSARAQMIYISDGRKEKVRAHFTYFGFRYVRIQGWIGEPDVRCFQGKVLYSDLDTAVFFQSSDEKLNRLMKNAFWGQCSNFLELPTDCPQRDERLGWTGDAQVFAPTACFQMDTRAFYRNFLNALRVEQMKNKGAIPHYIPNFDHNPGGSSVWGDAAIFIPMTLYENYGDITVLREQYPLMRDWMEWIIRADEEHGARRLWDFGFHFGDWLAQDGVTEQSMKGGTEDAFVACMYYYADAKKMSETARILELEEDVLRYGELAEEIYAAILHEYFTPAGRLAQETQTAYLLCLNFGVYVDKEQLIERLKKRLQKDCWTIKGGFVGATMMCRVLAKHGMEDLAAYFLFQEGFPGWMHCINLGATTIWERWNSILDDGRISGTEMNSLNHYAYGSVMEYVYRYLAGIDCLEAGFRRVRFAPQPTWRLRGQTVSYTSASGEYVSHWCIQEDGALFVKFSVPFGCSAIVHLPGTEETVELEAGTFTHQYYPKRDFRLKYNQNSRLGEILEDKEAMDILREDLPTVTNMIKGRDKEFLGMTFGEIRHMFFLGLNPQMVEEGTKRLFELKAFV